MQRVDSAPWQWGRFLLLLLCISLLSGGLAAQDDNGRLRNVAFLVDARRGLQTASTTNVGDDGLTRLVQMFVGYGADIQLIDLDAPIADSVELLVLVRPRRDFNVQQTAFLWEYLQKGGHLLLALDPNGLNNITTVQASSRGISQLLLEEYGISMVDDLWIEPWVTYDSLSDVVTSWSDALPDAFVPHPITEPLVRYGLPVRFWAGRSVFVDGLTGYADTNALIYAEQGYGETVPVDERRNPESLEFMLNLAEDNQGRLIFAAIAENRESGSRVALVGDSEIFQNIYGQTRIPGDETSPRYAGDFIFTQRLLSWLMGIPEADWPPLPDRFTWLALDGASDDWPETVPVVMDVALDTAEAAYDIRQAQALHNDQFLYVVLETASTVPQDARFMLRLSSDDTLLTFLLEEGTVRVQVDDESEFTVIDDAAYRIGPAAEIRLPLRIVGDNPMIGSLCIHSDEPDPQDCLDELLASSLVNTLDPVPNRSGTGPTAFTLNIANMRSGPSENDTILVQLSPRSLFSVLGRDEAGQWLKLRNGRYEGWVFAPLLATNAEVDLLPVVAAP